MNSDVPDRREFRESIIRLLDQEIGAIEADEISQTVDALESKILSVVRDVVRQQLGVVGTRVIHSTGELAKTGDVTLSLKMAPNPFDDSILDIFIHPADEKLSSEDQPEVECVSGLGVFKTVRVYAHSKVDADAALIASLAADILSSGYFWMNQELIQALRKAEASFEQEAHHIWRRHLFMSGKEKLESEVWLVLAHKEKIVYPIDGKVVERVMTSAEKESNLTGQSPTRIVADLLTTGLPFEHSFSKQALADDQRIEMDRAQAPYATTASAFNIAQSAIYPEEMSLEPIVFSNGTGLLAAYPSRLIDDMGGVVDSAKDDLIESIRARKSSLAPIWGRIKQARNGSEAWANVGRLIGGIIESMIK